jgi:hypothetical protein
MKYVRPVMLEDGRILTAEFVPRAFERDSSGVRLRRHKPRRWMQTEARRKMREREKEVGLEVELGTRGERVGWWGDVPGRTRTAHFWIEVEWNPLGQDVETRYESACGGWDLGRYSSVSPAPRSEPWLSEDTPRRVDIQNCTRACARCAYEVEAEDA